MTGENVKNFFSAPKADGDNKLTINGTADMNGDLELFGETNMNGIFRITGAQVIDGGTFTTLAGTSLTTVVLHGRIPDAVGLNGTSTETDGIPIPFDGKIVSIFTSLRKIPILDPITLTGFIDDTEITNGVITYPSGGSTLDRQTNPTANNTVIAGDNFNFRFIESNTTSKVLSQLSRSENVATASLIAHGYSNGQEVVLSGVNEAFWNGNYRIKIRNNDQFIIFVDESISASTTGTKETTTRPIIPINYIIVLELA